MFGIFQFLLISLLVFQFANSYNYLVINPIFGYSHVKFVTKLADTLADHGHNVTLFQPFHLPLKRLDGLVKNKNVEVINWYPSNFEELSKKEEQTFAFMWDSKVATNPVATALMLPQILVNEWKLTAKEILQDKQLFDQLKSKKFDAVINEIFEISGLYLGHLLEIPSSISVMSAVRFPGSQELFGQISPVGYVPADGSKHGREAGFLDRLNDVFTNLFDQMFFENLFSQKHEVCSDALGNGRDVPHWKDLIKKSPLFITNSNPYLEFAGPKVDNIIQVGGFTMDTEKIKEKKVSPLPDEYDKIMKERKHTVFISFGSVIRSYQMPNSFKSGIIQMFKNLPEVTFIWKYEEDNDVEFKKRLPQNVHLKKWVPQPAILADPRLRLFITHGGLGSTMEVAYSGIAALMVPVFADQSRNAAMLERHGGAVSFDKFELANSVELTKVVKEMINNGRYKTKAAELQNVLLNQPNDPKQTLVKNLEFAVKFPNLKSQVPEISSAGLIGYYYIDVFFFLGIVSIVAIYCLLRIVLVIFEKLKSRLYGSKIKSD